MKRGLLKGIIGVLAAGVILVGGYFVFMTVTDYKPEKEIVLEIENNEQEKIGSKNEFEAIIFNTGYAGLDKDADFFMDGGVKSKAESKEKVESNLKGMLEVIKEEDSDFILLQEVDYKAMRTFGVDQMGFYKENLEAYNSSDAINYKVPWVPVPITSPMGSVESGILSLSKYKVDSAKRFDLPGKEKWPRQLALLDRCFIEERYKLDSGKELVVINTHMSAYDTGGKGKLEQMQFMREYLMNEYKTGNYIVVGGDWNQELPGTDVDKMNPGLEKVEWIKELQVDFPNFKWGVDTVVPTSRNNDKPYKKGENFIAIIDGFLVSDNVDILEVKGLDLGFVNSDHNPVVMKFKLKE